MRRLAPFVALSLIVMLPGCIAKTALDVVTAPVKVAGKAVDMATTSQSEADEKRGRDLRKREEELGKLSRTRAKLANKCADGDRRACGDLDETDRQIENLGGPGPR